MDNYIPDVRQSEDHTAEEQMEEEVFLDVIVGKQILNKKGNFILTKNKFSVEITYEIIQLSDNGFQTWKALKKYIFTYFYT